MTERRVKTAISGVAAAIMLSDIFTRDYLAMDVALLPSRAPAPRGRHTHDVHKKAGPTTREQQRGWNKPNIVKSMRKRS